MSYPMICTVALQPFTIYAQYAKLPCNIKFRKSLLTLEILNVAIPPPESHRHSAEFLLLKGRCLSVAPAFSPTAEECLSRAVKLGPGLVEGWNTLGEQYWKKGDLTTAKTCFTGALQQVRWNNAIEKSCSVEC